MAQGSPESERHALEKLDTFMELFNAHDWQRVAQCLHYPHVRIAGGTVSIIHSAEDLSTEYRQAIRDERVMERGWHHSTWDEREVIQSGPDKVHVKVRFTRYDERGAALASYPSLYIVTCIDGRWGIQARSSFAP